MQAATHPRPTESQILQDGGTLTRLEFGTWAAGAGEAEARARPAVKRVKMVDFMLVEDEGEDGVGVGRI